jgi:hypothetical protein
MYTTHRVVSVSHARLVGVIDGRRARETVHPSVFARVVGSKSAPTVIVTATAPDVRARMVDPSRPPSIVRVVAFSLIGAALGFHVQNELERDYKATQLEAYERYLERRKSASEK